MPSNDDTKQQSEEATKGHAFGDAPVDSVLLDDYAGGAEDKRTDKLSNDDASAVLLPSDQSAPQEFTFFQKKKRAHQVVLVPSVAYASAAQITAFAAKLDSAVAVNAKTQRHIGELMTLISEVARTTTVDASQRTHKKLRRSKWLFYGCLVGFSVGWFLLFPLGHNLITQLAAFLAR